MKKILILSLEYNYITVNSWASLWFWQLKKDLESYYQGEVDIARWGHLTDPKKLSETYDEVVLVFPVPSFSNILLPGKLRAKVFMTLNNLTCIRSFLNFGIDTTNAFETVELKIINSFKKNDISTKVHNFVRAKPNIAFGNEAALTLWDEDTYVYLTNVFSFSTIRKYETATVFFDSLKYRTKSEMETCINNLMRKVVNIHAKKQEVVIPVTYENYGGDFLNYLVLTSRSLSIPLNRYLGEITNKPWLKGKWNPLTNQKNNSSCIIPYLQ